MVTVLKLFDKPFFFNIKVEITNCSSFTISSFSLFHFSISQSRSGTIVKKKDEYEAREISTTMYTKPSIYDATRLKTTLTSQSRTFEQKVGRHICVLYEGLSVYLFSACFS